MASIVIAHTSFVEKKVVFAFFLKKFDIKTKWTYEQKVIYIVLFWKIEVKDIWSFIFSSSVVFLT